MIGLRMALLGGFEARLASGTPLSLSSKKARALLAYLGVRPGQRHAREKLAALLWAERSDDQARGGLRQALVALRRALAEAETGVLRIEGSTLALDPAGVEVDVVAFERLVAEDTPDALEQAAARYRGDLLLGFTLQEPLFEDWLVPERERLREMALDALARLLAHQARAAKTERAIQTAVRLLALDPLQEAGHRALMRLYTRQGRRGAALKQYQVCVGALQRELGTAPEAETQQLYRELLRRPAEAGAATDDRGTSRSRPRRPTEAVLPALPAAEMPLVGRQAELARLRQLLDEVSRGRGHVATVVGEAGIGKTRLVGALVAAALAEGCRVLIGHGHESDSILPFGPWVDACRSGGLTTDEEALAGLHPALRAELTRLFPEAARPGLPPASDSALHLFESVSGLIEQVAAGRPLVIVLEDLHWADEMTLRLLAFVSRRVAAWPVLLVTTARPEETAGDSLPRRAMEDLSRASDAISVALSPLSRSDTTRLVRALTRAGSGDRAPAHVEERIWAMSEGNPFVAVEAMRALDQDGGELALPARVRELIARRLDRLGPRAQELAAVAAVIGRRFDFAILQAAGGMGERDAAEAVEEMVRHHVLQAVGDQLDFTHDRIRDVAYGRLLPPRRRVLHRAVAEALEGDAQDSRIEQLAHHALRGELGEKAVRYLRQAGNRAAARSALKDARTWFGQALGALEALPESRGTLEEAFETRLALRSALIPLGELRQGLDLLREAEAIARRLNDDARRGRVYAFMANLQARLDDPDEALVSGGRALEIADRLGDVRLRILATSYLAMAHFYRGDYGRVVELATANLAALPADWAQDFFGGAAPPSVNDRFRLIVALANLGRFREAAEHEAEIIRLAESTQQAYTIFLAYHAAGMLHLVKGDWAKTCSLLERQVAALRAGDIAGDLPLALAYSARALAHRGDTGLALSQVRESERLLEERSARGNVGNGMACVSLGRACLMLGRLDEARRLADRALEGTTSRVDIVPYALHLLGDIATRPDRFDAEGGEGHYRRALQLAEARGMRPLVAHCHLGLGTLYRHAGKEHAADEHLTLAAEMYREMAMDYWLAQAEATRAAVQLTPEASEASP